MAKKLDASTVRIRLERAYPEAACSLHFRSPFQLLVATVLSAQCTDERVNQVTPALFERCPTPQALAALPVEELERMIRPTGFFRNKAKSLKGAAERIVRDFMGEVPRTMEGLTALPGVARKTANVVLGSAFGLDEGFVVDTHVKRLTGRMGLSRESDPEKIERDLMEAFPRESWSGMAHRLIRHGREVCAARRPDCPRCVLRNVCPKLGVYHLGREGDSHSRSAGKARRSARFALRGLPAQRSGGQGPSRGAQMNAGPRLRPRCPPIPTSKKSFADAPTFVSGVMRRRQCAEGSTGTSRKP